MNGGEHRTSNDCFKSAFAEVKDEQPSVPYLDAT